MPRESEIEAKFWKYLRSDMTVMLGLVDHEDGHAQPMTAQIDEDLGDSSPLWFFTTRDNGLVRAMARGENRAIVHFSSKNHELFACVHGELMRDDDPLTVSHLWNPSVETWLEGGKDDPNLQLLRFSPERAEIWLTENSLFAGMRTLLGANRGKPHRGTRAEVAL